MTFTVGDRHDPAVLASARELVRTLDSAALGRHVQELVRRNRTWRGEQCLNLIAAESPTSRTVRALLGSEIGTRASGGHIGALSRCFPGLRYADEIEAVCVELLKQLFRAQGADQRLMGGMAGCAVAYAALARPGDIMMSLPLSAGGDSSGREDGPAGVRGLRIHDIPFDPVELTVDLDGFRREAERLRPVVVSLNQTTTLFPLPIAEMARIVAPWGGRLYFDAAHQAGLIAGGCYPNPLEAGAAVMTGSGGKTFSGPQSGLILWNDEPLGDRITEAIFPVLTGSHQLNRVAALAAAALEMREFGARYMAQVVANARSLARALHEHALPVVGARRGFTQTHQVLVDVRAYGGGQVASHQLEAANIMANKMLLPGEMDAPGGLRIGTVEITRLGMGEAEMARIAELIQRVLVHREAPETMASEVRALRGPFQALRYCLN